MTSDFSPADLAELDAELGEMAADFEELAGDFDEEDVEEFRELDAELSGSGLELQTTDLDLNSLIDDPLDVQFFGGYIRRKAAKLIRKLIAIVRRYRRCARCAPQVAKAVRLFKKRRYIAALRAAYSAFRCIRRCRRR